MSTPVDPNPKNAPLFGWNGRLGRIVLPWCVGSRCGRGSDDACRGYSQCEQAVPWGETGHRCASHSAAAARAKLTDYDLVWPAAVDSFEQRMLRRLLSVGEDLGLDLATGGLATGPLAGLVGEVQRSTAELLRWNDPRHLYLHSLCETP